MNYIQDLSVLAHQDRFTGGTYSLTDRPAPTDGYMVGGVSWSLVIDVNRLTRSMIRMYVHQHLMHLLEGTRYLGIWTDEATERTYLDVSEHVLSYDRAQAVAWKRGELAIWDNARREEINVRG